MASASDGPAVPVVVSFFVEEEDVELEPGVLEGDLVAVVEEAEPVLRNETCSLHRVNNAGVVVLSKDAHVHVVRVGYDVALAIPACEHESMISFRKTQKLAAFDTKKKKP